MTDNRAAIRAQRYQAAIHEAGHSVACVVLDVRIRAAMAWSMQIAEVERRDDAPGAAGIVIALGGGAAEQVLGVRDGLEWPSTRQLANDPQRDYCRAYSRALAMAGPAKVADLYGRCYQFALELVELHWPAVQRVASLLETRNVVSGIDIEEEVARISFHRSTYLLS